MRNYRHLDRYLNILLNDIYAQPPDEGHQAAIEQVIRQWLPQASGIHSILDVGCGQGQAIPLLWKYGKEIKRVAGVTLGEDAEIARAAGHEVFAEDMSFLPFAEREFDLVFARHVLEHSPMPLLTLMEWHRVSSDLLLLVIPNYQHYGPSGRNHYYVLRPDQWHNLLTAAGWAIVWTDDSCVMKTPFEYRWMCQKKEEKKWS